MYHYAHESVYNNVRTQNSSMKITYVDFRNAAGYN